VSVELPVGSSAPNRGGWTSPVPHTLNPGKDRLSDSSLSHSRMKKGTQRKVIIVDDILELVNLYTRALEFYGHKVLLGTSDPYAVLEAAKRGVLNDAEFAILDYRMEVINGLEVAKELLAIRPTIRIIVASADEAVEKEVRQVGFSFLRKPFRVNELLVLLGNE
jgi:DNA-binding NtrC family response regulator